MSYDVEVWLTDRPDLPSILPTWAQSESGCSLEGPRWILNCEGPYRAETSDAPAGIAQRLATVNWLVSFHLEGEANATARRVLLRAANEIGRAAHGIAVDLQTDRLYTPTGVARFVSEPTRGRYYDALQLTWFHVTGNADEGQERNAKLVDILNTQLPEALPRRYGEYEPPQYRLTDGGTAALVDFLARLSSLNVLIPHPPITKISIGNEKSSGWQQGGFEYSYRPNRVAIALPLSVARQPGWRDLLEKLFRDVAVALGIFYADMRVLRNQHGGPLTREEWEIVERHPGTPWRGIPKTLGCLTALGEPYASIWPAFAGFGTREGGILFAAASQWPCGETSTIVGQAPDDIRAPDAAFAEQLPIERQRERFARTFPFPRVRIGDQVHLGPLPEE